MKNLIVVLAVALFSAGINVNAQEAKPTPKKECSAKEKKSCHKSKKSCATTKSDKKV